MAHITVNFKSLALNMPVMLDVLVPEKCENCKTLYLLHGQGGDRESWLLKSCVAKYVEGRQLAVVMPSGNNKFWINNVNGKAYQTFVAEELPGQIEKWFAVSKEAKDRFIAGAGMGGFGALWVAAEYPEKYGAAFSYHDFAYMQAQCEALEARTALTVFGTKENGIEMVHKLEKKVHLVKEKGIGNFLICNENGTDEGEYPDLCLQQTIDYILSEGGAPWQS